MRVKTDLGVTECRFKDFAEQEPKLYEVQQRYRDDMAKAGKSGVAQEKAREACKDAVRGLFGHYRYLEDWKTSGAKTVQEWDAWIEAKPLAHRKLYYHHEVVAGCTMGEDE